MKTATDQRSKLVESALTLFAQRGYECVGVQEIVDSAGVTKPTLYHYFGSKVGLLDALLNEHLNPFYEELEKAANYSGDLPKTLRNIVSVYLDFAQRLPVFARFLLSMYFSPPESDSFRTSIMHYKRQQALAESVFMEAAKQHGNMRNRHERYAATLIGTINSYVSMYLNGVITVTDKVKTDIVQQFSHGIYS